jgi:UDP-N-acetylglucosamine diphosphorylase/glucosamine-1-phosphate N-acetyltransferase
MPLARDALFFWGMMGADFMSMAMNEGNGIAVVILAAGMGTRMKSEKAKVLHEIAGRSMISYVLETALGVTSCDHIVVVIGCQADAVRGEALKRAAVKFAHQKQQLGTGHAVLCAMDNLPENVRDVVILSGDMPFISQKTVKALIEKKRSDDLALTLLAARVECPKGYGRLFFDSQDRVIRIVEESDASETEKLINIINAGTYCAEKAFLGWSLAQIGSDNKQKELYLTDIVGIASSANRPAGAVIVQDEHEVIGVNSLDDLGRAASSLCQKTR